MPLSTPQALPSLGKPPPQSCSLVRPPSSCGAPQSHLTATPSVSMSLQCSLRFSASVSDSRARCKLLGGRELRVLTVCRSQGLDKWLLNGGRKEGRKGGRDSPSQVQQRFCLCLFVCSLRTSYTPPKGPTPFSNSLILALPRKPPATTL